MAGQKFVLNTDVVLSDISSTTQTLLWVDDKESEDNNAVQEQTSRAGVRLLRAKSTDEALAMFDSLGREKFYPPSHFRVMSNMTRVEVGASNRLAGLHFAEKLRRKRRELAKANLVTLTNDIDEAIAFATFKKKPIENLFPNFKALQDEGIEFKDVAPESPGGSVYTKYYINPKDIEPGAKPEASRIHNQVLELLWRYLDADHLPVLERIIVIDNPVLRGRFEAGLRELDERTPPLEAWPEEPLLATLGVAVPETPFHQARPALLWHCTSDQSETHICSSGFSLRKVGGSTGNKGWYGCGIYFTSIPSYASWYSHPRTAAYRAGDVCITLNWALTGRPFLMSKIDIGRTLEPGFTSHYAVTTRTRPLQEYPSPFGGYLRPMDGDELVVFDESHCLPQFVVELTPPKDLPGAK